MKESQRDYVFVTCAKCGKKLLKRKKDGSFYFRFGRKKNLSEEDKDQIFENGGFVLEENNRAAIEMAVRGAVQIRCLSPNCDHITIII